MREEDRGVEPGPLKQVRDALRAARGDRGRAVAELRRLKTPLDELARRVERLKARSKLFAGVELSPFCAAALEAEAGTPAGGS